MKKFIPIEQLKAEIERNQKNLQDMESVMEENQEKLQDLESLMKENQEKLQDLESLMKENQDKLQRMETLMEDNLDLIEPNQDDESQANFNEEAVSTEKPAKDKLKYMEHPLQEAVAEIHVEEKVVKEAPSKIKEFSSLKI